MKRSIIFLLLPFLTITVIFAQPFAGGNGTKANPYQVSTPVQLDSVRHYLDKSFVLLNDIDLDVAPYNTGEGWEPIGNYTQPFTGDFDGAGFVLQNLLINRTSASDNALFSYTENSTIKKIGIVNCKISGNGVSTSLISNSNNDTLINCYSTGNVAALQTCAAGLVCFVYGNSLYKNCYSTCNTIAKNGGAGGFCYSCHDLSIIDNCYATGKVESYNNNYAGGFIGMINGATINNCYSTGNVYGAIYVGGFVGYQIWSSKITNCYSTGMVNGKGEMGGFSGILLENSTVNNCFYNKETSGFSDSDKGKPQTTAEMKQQSTFTGWDFSDTWIIREDSTYPGLKSLNNAPFAFRDTLVVRGNTLLNSLLNNDYDLEKQQNGLTFKISSLFNLGITDSVSYFRFPAGTEVGVTDSFIYRVGEIIDDNEILWGNEAVVIVKKGTNDAPVITSEAPKQVNENSLYTYTVLATDVDGDALEYTLSNAPEGMSITDNAISWTPAEGITTSGEVTLTVSDGNLSATQVFTVTVSKISGITFTNNDSFSVFPNPANEELTVTFDGNQDKITKLLIVAADGRIVYALSEGNININNSNSLLINISGLPAGLYTLQISYGKCTKTQKLLKK